MTKRADIIKQIEDSSVISIVRSKSSADMIPVIRAIYEGGLPCIEVTTNTPEYLSIISSVRETMPGVVIGAGTVTNRRQAIDAITAGAQYLVTPITKEEIVHTAHQHNVPVVMGAFSPTEIHLAHEYSADFIKLFPADQLGPSYLKGVMATLPKLRFVPTGGIGANNLSRWMALDIAAVGIGSAVVNNELIAKKDYDGIKALSEQFKKLIDQNRAK